MKLIEDGKSPLQTIVSVLFRRKWQIIIVFALLVSTITMATLRAPKLYQARMKILVKNERAGIVVSASSNDQSSSPGEVSENEINTEIELLNNNDLLRQVVIASGLDKVEGVSGKKLESREALLENAVGGLQHSLKISPARKADIIDVQYVSANPHQVAAVLRQLAALYLEAHLRLHSTPGTHEFFKGQEEHYRAELKSIEAKLREFCAKNDIVMFAPQQESVLRREADLSSALLTTDASIREYTNRIAQASTQLSAALPRVVTQSHTSSSQGSTERLGTMLIELQNRRTQLLSKFQPDDRMVQEVSQEIANTEEGLQQAKKLTGSDQITDVNPVRQALELDVTKEQNELAGLQARRQALVHQLEEYRAQLKRLGGATEEYNDLIRRQKEAEDNYALYARKTEEARIADSLDQQKIANVAIAENPVEPHHPFTPNVPLNIELGTIASAFLSLGLAFSLEYLARPFQRDVDFRPSIGPVSRDSAFLDIGEESTDLEALTGLPVLATSRLV